jgi:hypothetical protein
VDRQRQRFLKTRLAHKNNTEIESPEIESRGERAIIVTLFSAERARGQVRDGNDRECIAILIAIILIAAFFLRLLSQWCAALVFLYSSNHEFIRVVLEHVSVTLFSISWLVNYTVLAFAADCEFELHSANLKVLTEGVGPLPVSRARERTTSCYLKWTPQIDAPCQFHGKISSRKLANTQEW